MCHFCFVAVAVYTTCSMRAHKNKRQRNSNFPFKQTLCEWNAALAIESKRNAHTHARHSVQIFDLFSLFSLSVCVCVCVVNVAICRRYWVWTIFASHNFHLFVFFRFTSSSLSLCCLDSHRPTTTCCPKCIFSADEIFIRIYQGTVHECPTLK